MGKVNRGELMLRAVLAAEAGQQATSLGHIDALCLDVATESRAEERTRVVALLRSLQGDPLAPYIGTDDFIDQACRMLVKEE